MDMEILDSRKITLTTLYHDKATVDKVEEGFIYFSISIGIFEGYNVIKDKGLKILYAWWETHGATCTILQLVVMGLLSQVTSSSCCKRNGPHMRMCRLSKRAYLSKVEKRYWCMCTPIFILYTG